MRQTTVLDHVHRSEAVSHSAGRLSASASTDRISWRTKTTWDRSKRATFSTSVHGSSFMRKNPDSATGNEEVSVLSIGFAGNPVISDVQGRPSSFAVC